jgi:hypothetical protein
LNKLRGFSSAVAIKSIEGYREVLDAASAVVVGENPPENWCRNYEQTKSIQKEWTTFCFEAHQQCCSSEKKYVKWENFCEFYAFDEPETDESVEISEGIAFDAEDSTEGGIDCTMCQDEKCDADEAALDVIKE